MSDAALLKIAQDLAKVFETHKRNTPFGEALIIELSEINKSLSAINVTLSRLNDAIKNLQPKA